MSLLQSLSRLAGGQSGGAVALVPIVLEQLKQYPGGFMGLIAAFQKGGLGEVIASWIGKGANLPISPDQLGSVLDAGVLDQIIGKSGQSRGDILSLLSNVLPDVIDQATPDGDTENPRFNTGSLLESLPGLLKKFGA